MIQFSVQIEKCKANKDRTLDLTLGTQELSAEDKAQIFNFFERQIWCAFAETTITKNDLNIPESITETFDKSPSQRLRDRLYRYYATKYDKKGVGFDDWYRKTLDEIGQRYLEKIN